MNALLRAVQSPRRPLTLFLVGALAGLAERAVMGGAWQGIEREFIPAAVYAVVIGFGLALEADLPRARYGATFVWALVAAAGSALFTPVSAAVGRVLFGAGVAMAVTGAGALHSVPWAAAARGALGALAAAVLGNLVTAQGAPIWISTGIDALLLGVFLSQGRAERLVAALSGEMGVIRVKGGEALTRRADAFIALAAQLMRELESQEEANGEDLSESREALGRTARRGLALMRRMAELEGSGLEFLGTVEAKLATEEQALRESFGRELAKTLALG